MAKFKNSFSFISMQSYQQILSDYEDLTSSNGPMFFHIKEFLNSLSHTSIVYKNLFVVGPSENFQCFLIWLSQVDVY